MTVASADMTDKEVINDYKENYAKVRKLLDEESKNDPENEPYLSKYKAKEILTNMRQSLDQLKKNNTIDQVKFDAMLGNVLLHIGIIDMETEELTSSEQILSEAVEVLNTNWMKAEIVYHLLKVYNNLGILWFNRDDPEKAKIFLLKSKNLYEAFKHTSHIPIPIEKLLTDTASAEPEDLAALEKVHTLTLYYLAQVYGALKENLKSGMYCHITLKRQLQYTDFDPIDWALNAATLSQFFAELHHFTQARHHLAAASCVLDEYAKKLELIRQMPDHNEEEHKAQIETFNHRSADVARCWAKYCLILLTASKARLMNDAEDTTTQLSNVSLVEEKDEPICELHKLVFHNMGTGIFEDKISDKFLLTYQDAREVFLSCQSWLNKAKEYYKLDSLASDYVQLVQDSSQAYYYLAFFEEDDDRRAKMHKRRADMLEDVLKEINPTYYLQYCRQLWYELGEVYSEILNIKLEIQNKTSEKPTPHALKKINMLCEKSIENYDHFLKSVKDNNGKLPDKLDPDMIRPVVNSYAFIGRNSMKRIAMDKGVQLAHARKSYECYKAVVDICERDENAYNQMREEFSLCSEMVKILPIKILKLENELGLPPASL